MKIPVLNENKAVKRVLAYGLKTHLPKSLSTFCFSLSKNKREELAEKYPEIKNHSRFKSGGIEFEDFVFNLIINKSHRTAKSICKNLNSSNIGYEDWSVKEEKKDYCLIVSKKANSVIRIDF